MTSGSPRASPSGWPVTPPTTRKTVNASNNNNKDNISAGSNNRNNGCHNNSHNNNQQRAACSRPKKSLMLSPVFLTSAGSACPSGRATRTPVSFSSSIEYGNNMHMHRHPLTHRNESTTRGRLVLASHYPNTRAPPTGFSPQATLRPLSRSSRGSCFRKKTACFFSKKQLFRGN